MQLQAVGKRYGLRQPWVVRDVTQDVAAGRLIKVEGPNGSGKSTLLRVMAGVTAPSAGRVTGRPRAGYVPERFPGGLAFSAREYLTHMSRIHGLSGPAVPAAVDEWLERLGATAYAGSPLRTLSRGMCQKVAIAQALLARPWLLVLDEAWTGLDQAARGTLDAAVAERLAEGATVVFVDHDPARLADRVDKSWRLTGGTVAATDGGAHAGEPIASAAATGAVVIELTGLEAGSLSRIGRLPGVVAVVPARVCGRAADGPGLATVTVLAAASDTVLRHLLNWDGVHVRVVRAEPAVAVTELEPPVTGPESPVNGPESPVNGPESPVTRPEAGQ
jgi:ABC-2 type transport system ATP-binding protein